MKYLLLIIFALAFYLNAAAQDKKFEFQDACGDPEQEDTFFIIEDGKVIKILDGDSLVIENDEEKEITVNLIAVDATPNEAAAKNFLTKALLNKKIVLYISDYSKSREVDALIKLNGREINRMMIEQGIAFFQGTTGYTFSLYMSCVYEKLEEKAKQEKLGIWAK